MSRPMPTGLAAKLSAFTIPAAFLVELDWPGGSVYLWNGYHPINWNGHTYSGLGHLGSISDISESGDGTANGMTLQLSGIPTALVAEILKNDTQGRRALVWLAVVEDDHFAVDPVCLFDGVIDQPAHTNDGSKATISLALEKEYIDNRSGAARYTPEDQKQDYPDDLGLDFVPGLAGKTFSWGKDTYYGYDANPGGGEPNDPSQTYE